MTLTSFEYMRICVERTAKLHSGVNNIYIKLETPQLDFYDTLQFILPMMVF